MKMCLPALKKCVPAFLGLSLLASASIAHAAPKVGVSVANYMIATWPNLDDTTCGVNCFNLTYSTVPATGVPKYWEYTNGVPLMGVWKLYEKTGNVAYYNYVKKFIDSKIDANGNIDYTFGGTAVRDPHIQDTMQPGMILPALYKKTKDPRYLQAMVNLRAVFNTMSVNPEGAWWHKPTYPNQQWLDSTYMSLPFLSMYAKDYADKQVKGDAAVSFNMITKQLKLMSDNTLNATKGLYYHGWNDSADGVWAGLKSPPAIGATTSPVLWSRSIAWLYVGVIEVLENLPEDHPDRNKLRQIVKNISIALEKYQDPKTGLWNQVIDVTNDKLPANGGYPNEAVPALPNWNETSASALFVYGLSKAERADILAPHYREVADRGWAGVKKQVEIAGTSVKVHGTVVGLSVNGSYNAYVNADFRTDLTTGDLPAPAGCTQVPYVTPAANCKYIYVRDNVPQGIGAVMLAASEME